jgi:hypothetical protein
MLNDIRVHIHPNEEIQEAIEARSAPYIEKMYKQNKTAFAKHIPSLIDELKTIDNNNISIFCNQNEEFNIVDFGLGRTLYGQAPVDEVAQQCQQLSQHAAYLTLSDHSLTQPNGSENWESDDLEQVLKAYQSNAKFAAAKGKTADVLVVLGLGLGHHIDWLIEHHSAKHIIIYEPEKQYFKTSCMVKDWQSVLNKVAQTDTSLYFQLGMNGISVIEDLTELSTHFEVKDVTVFQHYYLPSFDAVIHTFRTKTWQGMKDSIAPFSINDKFTQYTPLWLNSPNIQSLSVTSKNLPRFQTNLGAFLKFYPNIYAEFANYEPQTWAVVKNEINQVNLFNRDNGACWYGSHPAEEGYNQYKTFEQFPNKDGLILGYDGEKLKHYYHYRLVKQTEKLLQKAEDEACCLPDTIKSLILFGLGAGYQLESLLEHKEVEKLFICEPNRDFFFASLFAIDWATILDKIDRSDANLYINIGDDGTNLFRDLVRQFYNIGPYILGQTFFCEGYYNASLNASIVQLREELQIVVAMGEYFDHACFAIEHTKEALRNGIPFLRAKPSQYLNAQQRELPIIFVGNGPSLDYSIETIRELQNRAIVVSCGTSLQVLQRNNIVPDFHAEIELNRATYDWAYRVNDLEYLKKITLLSCNGIHPDTCKLYKDVKFAFKAGESATISALNVIGEDKAELLEFSFPTVSNFAINLFLKIGFNQFYLFGVDMGFIDKERHHSAQSGYYNQQGKELSKLAISTNTGLLVAGNFRAVVNTKYEFKLAKTIIEQVLAAHEVDCYNTSDGARIEGAAALNIDNVLLMSTSEQKQNVLQTFESCFCTLPALKFINEFESKYNNKLVLAEIKELQNILQMTISNQYDVFSVIEKQKQFLFNSYNKDKSLFFYYLYGTMNYVNSVLSKAAMHQDINVALDVAQQTISLWVNTLNDVQLLLCNTNQLFDTSSSFTLIRERLVLEKQGIRQITVNVFKPDLTPLVSASLSSLASIYPIEYSINTVDKSTEHHSADKPATAKSKNQLMEKDRSTIYCVQNKQDWQQLIVCLEEQDKNAQRYEYAGSVMVCLMGEFESMWFQQAATFTHLIVSFQVLPQILELSSADDYKQGNIPFSPLNLHLESAIKHLNDANDYSIFIEKLEFSNFGLRNASRGDTVSEFEKSEVKPALQDEGVKTEYPSSDISPVSTSSDKFPFENKSEAHRYIEQNIMERIYSPVFIDYNTYIGIPRNILQASINATMCDSANSRGLNVNRQFNAVELLQTWQKQSVVDANINFYLKAHK